MMWNIKIKGARFFSNVGVTDKERSKKQEIIIDVEISKDLMKAAKSGNIRDTINYSEVYDLIEKLLNGKSYNLIETIAENISSEMMIKFHANEVLARVMKPKALKNADYASVEVSKHA